jgi:hypothetical protein
MVICDIVELFEVRKTIFGSMSMCYEDAIVLRALVRRLQELGILPGGD